MKGAAMQLVHLYTTLYVINHDQPAPPYVIEPVPTLSDIDRNPNPRLHQRPPRIAHQITSLTASSHIPQAPKLPAVGRLRRSPVLTTAV
ncbi:hypothetical protein G7K_2566-t1 [Saitoella complicata NRRL Y-17804]|uniref:Uncharacterized protein n=1 Tax=Saitoella complicata (strain BCRC 22490 / CBS 7301 / JCM 7358 / NBRC 10748 / NRRL Y-17804) TaxID=698492 RepID=A0A0E9NF11_SAICN|nr:hypothetical protein G7K_2566-t1 [Saitoella complicata NRRL Y-17804]